MEDALYDSQAVRGFAGIDLSRESAPDATTLLKFRRQLETHVLPVLHADETPVAMLDPEAGKMAGGYHKLSPFESAEHVDFKEIFFNQLLRYQYVSHSIPNSDELRLLLIEFPAGIPRLLIALCFAAQRVALERMDDTFRLEGFLQTATRYLAPVQPAVADSRLMARLKRCTLTI